MGRCRFKRHRQGERPVKGLPRPAGGGYQSARQEEQNIKRLTVNLAYEITNPDNSPTMRHHILEVLTARHPVTIELHSASYTETYLLAHLPGSRYPEPPLDGILKGSHVHSEPSRR